MSDTKEYEDKRNFSKTPEPIASKNQAKNNIFVIQKHYATNLHYDFRLEIDGVLKSWAIPKGVSNIPMQKRLAVQVEDHPLEYANFEGEIPEGNYGAGKVEIYDRGTFDNISTNLLKESFDNGKIEVNLKGTNINGHYAIIRTKMSGNENNWLIFKMKK